MQKELSSLVRIRFSDCDPIGHLNNVKYLEYMLNAREDHVESGYGFTYEEYTRKTGCTWITVQNEIAYLREVRYNARVLITSKTIEVGDTLSKVEILMTSPDGKIIHSVLWLTVLYFDMKTRRAAKHPDDTKELFQRFLVNMDEKDFASRVQSCRKFNKAALK
ncbi:acyl-CoA thioesterase [Kaistella palustris]|uniref:acyl-CoA thioesterase n=1 Tax=Kaistella palustris TaxID=493376 RepID=UPI00042A4D4B|nr:acyl-CoA thioesterase [Kaistella palustris]